MKALVLSGAGNFGPMQVGAMQVVLESGFHPELVVGSSAGSLNGAFYAADPTLAGLKRLVNAWNDALSLEVELPPWPVIAYRIWQDKENLVDNWSMVTYLERELPEGVSTFADLKALHGIQALATAVSMETGSLRIFGDQSNDRVVDGLMASTAVPPFLPPWHVGDQRYFDGGILANLPILPAVERGAKEIIALDVSFTMGSSEAANGMLEISGYALALMINHQTEMTLQSIDGYDVSLKTVTLVAPTEVEFWDFQHVDSLVEIGRLIARESLAISN